MKFKTHNDLVYHAFMSWRYCTHQFQPWVIDMAVDNMNFDWADGPLDAPV